jgi:hypothetical protein
MGDGPDHDAGFGARLQVPGLGPVRPGDRLGGGDEGHQHRRREPDARGDPRRHPEGRQEEQGDQVAVDPVLEVVATDDQGVVAEVRGDDAARDRAGVARDSDLSRPRQANQRRPHPDQCDQQPDPDPVLEREARRVAETAFRPRRDVLGVVGVRQPLAVREPPPQDVGGHDQQRCARQEPPKRVGAAIAALPASADQEGDGTERAEQAVWARQRGGSGAQGQLEDPAMPLIFARGQGLVQPPDEAEVEERGFETRAQPGQEGPIRDRAEQDQYHEGEAVPGLCRRQPHAGAEAVCDQQRPVPEDEGEEVREMGRLDAGQPPDQRQQRHPQEAGVTLDRLKGRRIPGQAMARDGVGRIAERDERIIGVEEERSPADERDARDDGGQQQVREPVVKAPVPRFFLRRDHRLPSIHTRWYNRRPERLSSGSSMPS